MKELNWDNYTDENKSPLFYEGYKRLLLDNVDLNKEMTVLDAGCGTGRWSLLMAPYVKKVIGLDNNQKAIDVLQNKVKQGNTNIETLCNSITSIPLPDNSVDMTFTNITLQHITGDDFVKAVGEIKRVTKPGGQIVLIEHSFTLIKNTPDLVCRKPKEYAEAFKPAKLKKVSGVLFPYLKHLGLKKISSFWLGKLLPMFSPQKLMVFEN
jgi:ubiquinone/menaquinone biosynthesis C-methylase UbiE|tara:strand:+ start:13016 stop:13642 length:627 start_codon:yes stop_codon:yes gene_type:complete